MNQLNDTSSNSFEGKPSDGNVPNDGTGEWCEPYQLSQSHVLIAT